MSLCVCVCVCVHAYTVCACVCVYIRLFESVCPWADLPYEEQLRRKEVAMKKALKQMSTYLSKRDYVPVSSLVGGASVARV